MLNTLFCLLSLVFIIRAEIPRPRGVPISKASLYDASREFQCFDGSETIPYNYVNDDYCDCKDGSDEPGTAACPNGHFHCTNAGHKPLNIVSSRVNDGICDCCDGSDEYSGVISCKNNCKELGRQDRERMAQVRELQQAGYTTKKELIEEGKKIHEEKQVKLDELEKERVNAEARKNEMEAKKNEAETPEREAKDKHEKAWEEVKAQREIEKDKAKIEVAFKEMDVNVDGFVDVAEMKRHSEFDIDSNGDVSDDEAKEYMEGTEVADQEHFKEKMWPVIKDLFKFKDSKPAEDKGDKDDEAPPTPTEAIHAIPPSLLPDSKYAEAGDDDDEEEDGYDEEEEDEDDEIPPLPEEVKSEVHDTEELKMPDYDSETQKLIEAADEARKLFEEADQALKDIDRDLSDIRSFLSLDFGPNREFQVLKDQCFEYTDREYTYKFCPYDRGTQRPKAGGTETTLGNWGQWDGPEDNRYSVQKYDRGQTCWNGPARSVRVIFKCGIENRVISASEPSRCEYQFEFETPCSCSEPTSNLDKAHDEL